MQVFIVMELHTYDTATLITPRQACSTASTAEHYLREYEEAAQFGEQYWIVELTLEDTLEDKEI